MLSNRTQRILTALAAVACLAAAGCGSSSSKPSTPAPAPAAKTQAGQSAPAATTPDSGSGGGGNGAAIVAKCQADAGGQVAKLTVCLAEHGVSLDDPKVAVCMQSAKSQADVSSCLAEAAK